MFTETTIAKGTYGTVTEFKGDSYAAGRSDRFAFYDSQGFGRINITRGEAIRLLRTGR
jgi:hypothetical protein